MPQEPLFIPYDARRYIGGILLDVSCHSFKVGAGIAIRMDCHNQVVFAVRIGGILLGQSELLYMKIVPSFLKAVNHTMKAGSIIEILRQQVINQAFVLFLGDLHNRVPWLRLFYGHG